MNGSPYDKMPVPGQMVMDDAALCTCFFPRILLFIVLYVSIIICLSISVLRFLF